MTLMGEMLRNRRLHAPAEDGGVLVDPPLEQVEQLVAANVDSGEQADYDFHGRSLHELREQGRRELLGEALHYTRAYRDVADVSGSTTRFFLAGHQPQLFHPGVWLKNFGLGTLAEQHRAVAINLLIDSDTIKNAAIRVPSGSVQEPTVEPVAFDRASPEIPYEERSILDRELFASFGRRAAKAIAPLVPHPLLETYWPLAVRRADENKNLGQCIAQSRHQLEGQWGLNTLEVPQCRIGRLEAFRWFTAHLLAHLPRLWEVYNSSVEEYRRVNHIRSTAHPVPNLAMQDDWLESPLWMWRVGAPRRRRVFARQQGDEIVLSDRDQVQVAIPLTPEGDAAAAVEQLAKIAQQGIKIRTRALVTTMFARLVLSDLFIHGIGGAKYDQLTDQLISRFFGLAPPGFMVISATLRLQIPRPNVTADDLREVNQQLRELEFHPERFLNGQAASNDPQLAELLKSKQRLVLETPRPLAAKARCRSLRAINEALQPRLADQRQALLAEREQRARALRSESVLASREYAFCLYPKETLRKLVLEFRAANV